jgi:spermidine synthase
LQAADGALEGRVRSLEIFTLVYAVFVAGLCSIVYELLIATTVVYFQGDSITYFSLTIGMYMAAMVTAAYVSKYATGNLLKLLIAAEVTLGFLGGFAVPVLYVAYSHSEIFLWVYAVFTLAIGFLIGLEVPFLTRLLERYASLRISIAHVLSLDYFGALVAPVAFPLVLLPFLGVFKSALYFGLINMTIGLLLLWRFRTDVGESAAVLFRGLSVLIAISIVVALIFANQVLGAWNSAIYDGRILHSEQTRYQQIVLTKYRSDVRLYLDGNLQFSSLDEYRYHEALVHVPMAFAQARALGGNLKALVLGGGDGMAVRELLKHRRVTDITLVDLDPAVVALARDNPHFAAANADSLAETDRLSIVHGDGFNFLKQRAALYDVIIADLPDPNNTELARLYTREFYRLARGNLAPGGLFVSQSTSPLYAPDAFWSIRATIADVFTYNAPYHALVPSFGDWGFVVASDQPLNIAAAAHHIVVETRFLDADVFPGLFVFEKDLRERPVEVSTLDRPVVLNYYLKGWRHWGR